MEDKMIKYNLSVFGSRERRDIWEFNSEVECDSYDDIKNEIEYAVEKRRDGVKYIDTEYGDSTTTPDEDSIGDPISGEVRLYFPQIIQIPEAKHNWSKVYFDIVVENKLWVASYFDHRIVSNISLDNVISQIRGLLQIEPEIQSVGGFYIDWNPNPEEDKDQQLLRLSKRKI
jgi:hypothetical protein